MISINVMDEISPTVAAMVRGKEKYLRHVAKAIGYWISTETKADIKKGEPGGMAWKKRTPWKKVRKPIAKVKDASAPTSWYGKMKKAIGYSYEDYGVNIGWLSKTAAFYGDIQEAGQTRQVTESVRGLYREAGVSLGANKRNIKLPARPIYKPMSIEMFPKLPEFTEEKLISYVNEKVDFGKRNRRKYRV